ncbi:MAG: hypothetical protein ACTHOP_09810 [Mesorhizobium sp.]
MLFIERVSRLQFAVVRIDLVVAHEFDVAAAQRVEYLLALSGAPAFSNNRPM